MGDVTRQTFRSGRHYRSVRQQQGRVQLDADWNEQVDIQAYLDRTVTADLVGGSGAPRTNAGMAITDAAGNTPKNVAADELWIAKGHYYVQGILCENDEPVPLAAQPDLPGVGLPAQAEGDGTWIAFLDVWLEHLTAHERPELREVALGGPDTTTRARTVWHVRLRRAGTPLPADAEARKARMRARAVAAPPAEHTPCVVGSGAAYRRLENQLYRVEVFDPSEDAGGNAVNPTFVWSRENGSVIAAVTAIDGILVTIAAPGRDDRLAFRTGNRVEVTDLGRTRRGERGYLGTLGPVDGTSLTVAWDGAAPIEEDLPDRPVVRRWDGRQGPQSLFAAPPEPVDPADPQLIPLEDGIHVAFDPDGTYRTGDHWLIPARTANAEGAPVVADLTGTIEWPRDANRKELPELPAGVTHHYADIARLARAGDRWSLVEDLRPVFGPLTDRPDVTAAGGDGQEARPGEWLDEPLRVAVTGGLLPVAGATIRFTADRDASLIAPPGDLGAAVAREDEVPTGDDGVAERRWRLDPEGPPSQHVTASLLDADGDPTGPELRFTASLSRADRVEFVPGGCAALAGATTVQDALMRLAKAPVLVAVGGDGQTGTAGADLAAPIEVRVRACGAPVEGATVRFAAADGAVTEGAAAPGPTAEVGTGADGTARCRWRLGERAPVQALTATLLDGTNPDPRALPLTFLAGVVPETLAVDRVELPVDTPLVDGAFVAAADLAGGVAVVLDGEPATLMPESTALRVTLDLPFPLSQSDRDLWTDALAGTLPLDLGGTVAVTTVGGEPAAGGQPTVPGDPAVGWNPSEGAKAFLGVLIAKVRARGVEDPVRGHVRLAGSVLGPGVMDHARWFLLVETVTHLVVVPHRESPLRLAPAKRAIALSVSRDALRAGLPSGITVQPGTVDLTGARKAARRIFPAAGVRPLVLVVDERYQAAGEAVRDGLATVEVGMELHHAADPAAVAAERITAGEIVDGILTDVALPALGQGIDRFRKPFRL